MRSPHSLDRIDAASGGTQPVADAGLLLPATLARHLGLSELVNRHLDLGRAAGAASAGDKVLTLVMPALAGGDCIDDADALRAGGTARLLGSTVKAASTPGTFLRCSRWGRVRQLDRASREPLARARGAGAGPGAAPLAIGLDSTVCEAHGLAKEGGTRFTRTGVRGHRPLLAVAAGTGEVLMARLRGGNASSGRSAGHSLRETVGRVRSAGATGELTVRGDSGFCVHDVVAVARRMRVRFSITIRRHKGIRALIEAIPDDAWTPIPRWLTGGADAAETTFVPFAAEKDATPVRLIVRRVRPTPGSQLAAFALHDCHALVTGRVCGTLELEADHRRHAEVENAIRDLEHGVALNRLPSGRFAASGARLAVEAIAHNLARWTARLGLGAGTVTAKTLRRRLFGLAGRLARPARRPTLHLPAGWPWAIGWTAALARLRAVPLLA